MNSGSPLHPERQNQSQPVWNAQQSPRSTGRLTPGPLAFGGLLWGYFLSHIFCRRTVRWGWGLRLRLRLGLRDGMGPGGTEG